MAKTIGTTTNVVGGGGVVSAFFYRWTFALYWITTVVGTGTNLVTDCIVRKETKDCLEQIKKFLSAKAGVVAGKAEVLVQKAVAAVEKFVPRGVAVVCIVFMALAVVESVLTFTNNHPTLTAIPDIRRSLREKKTSFKTKSRP